MVSCPQSSSQSKITVRIDIRQFRHKRAIMTAEEKGGREHHAISGIKHIAFTKHRSDRIALRIMYRVSCRIVPGAIGAGGGYCEAPLHRPRLPIYRRSVRRGHWDVA